MKKYIALLTTVFILGACNNEQTEAELEYPTDVQPVSDAIPDSLRLVNDSVIVPDASRDTLGNR